MESSLFKNGTTANFPVSSIWNDHIDQACLDEGARAAINKRVTTLFQQGKTEMFITLTDVEYILGTAKNWKGPISEFSLDVVKASADQIVSLCFPGKPIRINETTLRFKHANFVPPDRVVVNFYKFTSKP